MFHFATLLPYSKEVWSNVGLLPRADLNLTHGFFPSILNVIDSPLAVQLFVGLLLLCALLFLVGALRPWVSLVLWYGWVCLLDRNNLISNPGIPFVGWILLCCAVIPKGEPLTFFGKKKDDWQFPIWLFIGAWAIMAVGYSISGWDKMQAPSWRDGSAIIHLLNNPLARDWALRNWLLEWPDAILHCITWSILFLEIAFLPLALWSKTRKWVWLAMIVLHLNILLIVDFADLTVGMLMIHWFTFDGAWLKPLRKKSQLNFVFFDGVCGLCNNFVDFLLKEDKAEVLKFSPLQGETANTHIKAIDANHLQTVVFKTDAKTYFKSDAVIEIMRSIGGLWRLAVIFKIVPTAIRNYFYDLIAKNRLKWFGQKESCRMPTQSERGRLFE